MTYVATPVLCDRELAIRLELSEVQFATAWAEALLTGGPAGQPPALLPLPPGGAYVLSRPLLSELNRAIGVGLFSPATPGQLDRIEQFFREQQAPPVIDVTPFSQPADLPEQLTQRDFRPGAWLNKRVIDLQAYDPPTGPPVRVEEVGPDQQSIFGELLARSLGDDEIRQLAPTWFTTKGLRCFIAYSDGQPMGAASLYLKDGVAALYGTSTRHPCRSDSIRQALLHKRLVTAKAAGCAYAWAQVRPGSPMDQLVEKAGFGIAYRKQLYSKELF